MLWLDLKHTGKGFFRSEQQSQEIQMGTLGIFIILETGLNFVLGFSGL
jgi:hypothetical protein